MSSIRKNIAVCASGRGSNFVAIAKAIESGSLKANLVLLVCDVASAPVIERAKELKVPFFLVERSQFPSAQAFEEAIVAQLQAAKADLVVLAGFMRIIGQVFLAAFANKIVNIHPALLPAFKGAHAISDAFAYGVKVTGVTVHFIDAKIDHGPIILQKAVEVKETDTLELLEERIHAVEHELYPAAIQLVLDEAITISGRTVDKIR